MLIDANGNGSGLPGIQFDAEVASVKSLGAGYDTEGQWTFTQTLTPARKVTMASGKKQHDINNGKLCLDESFKYSGKSWSTGSGSQKTDDSPFFPRDSKIDIKLAFDSEYYTMFLMFTPPGDNSRPVPLQKLSWVIDGYTEFSNGQWDIYTFPDMPIGAEAGTAVVTTSFPTWISNTLKSKTVDD